MAFPPRPVNFKQPSPDATAAGGHPHRNLGSFLHAPREVKRHNERIAPKPSTRSVVPAAGDFKPKGNSQAKSKFVKVKSVAGTNQGQSDVNSEAIGSSMGPAAVSSAPPAFKSKTPKAKQMPFYG